VGDIDLLLDPTLPISPELRAALLTGYRALASRDSEAKAQAVQALLALPEDQQSDASARLLADLGATHEAFQIATRIDDAAIRGSSLFWHRSMRETLADPSFPAVAEQLGLLKYWTTTHTRPDVCNERGAAAVLPDDLTPRHWCSASCPKSITRQRRSRFEVARAGASIAGLRRAEQIRYLVLAA
jgi:hypothetical protein